MSQELARVAAERESLRAICAKMREALETCSELFSDIRGDWTDPRSECREGQQVIAEALSCDIGREALERLKRLEAIADAAGEVVDEFQADGGVSEYFEALVELREAVEVLRALEGGGEG